MNEAFAKKCGREGQANSVHRSIQERITEMFLGSDDNLNLLS